MKRSHFFSWKLCKEWTVLKMRGFTWFSSLPVKKEDKKSGLHVNYLFPLHIICLKTIFFPILMACKPLHKHDQASDYINPWNRGVPHALFTLHLYPSLLLDTALYPQVQFQHTSFWSYLQTHAHVWKKHILNYFYYIADPAL